MKKTLLPLSALALLTMIGAAACGGQSSSSPAATTSETSATSATSVSQYKVSITNKQALQATWYVGDASRSVTVDLTPKVNVLDALADKTLTIESSNPEVVKATGASLSPVAKGKATITVTYHDVKDTVDVTIGEATAKEKYGTVHAGTLEDPLDNADAIKVGLWAKENGDTKEDLYIKGVVERFYEAPEERGDGAVSFFLKAGEKDGGQFEVYRVVKKDAEGKTSGLTWKEITVGSTVVSYGRITYYAKNNQAETAQGTTFFVSSDKGETEDPKVTEAESVAKVVEAGKALADGASTYDFVKVTGYVVIKDSSNYWLADSKDVKDPKKTDLLELYGVSKEDEAICLKGAKITVTLRIKNYHDQVEAIGMKDFVEVTKGEPWQITYIEKNVAGALEVINALEDGKTTEEYYAVTGVIGEVTYAFKNGTLSFTMGDTANDTTLLTCYKVATDEATAAKLVAGTKVKIGGKLQKYVKNEAVTPELVSGTVLDIIEDLPEGAVTVSFDVAKYVADKKVENGTKVETIALDEVVTAKASNKDGGGNTGKMYTGTKDPIYSEWRFYKSEEGKLTITAKEGYDLYEVTVGLATSNYGDPTDTKLDIVDGVASYTNADSNWNIKSITAIYAPVTE